MDLVVHILLFTIIWNGWSTATANRLRADINAEYAEELAKNGSHFFVAMTRAGCYYCGHLMSKFDDFEDAFQKANVSLIIHPTHAFAALQRPRVLFIEDLHVV
ncbi:hypothetical protein Y032_0004g2183 [Ancylostoma ceylanicum]|uniref:Thioredoxin-like fold domain-containing protein n=1 Tax=Ancylostoma ceylanicum TaxID=53326 RepID=A0A016VW01_9BILA|nr:hypothetical protein Y032_0004g2183 [Ancylostoma ceylanicum]